MRILKKISRQAVILSAVLVMIAAIFVSNKTVANAAGAVVKNLNSVNVNFDITGFKEGNALPSGDSFNVQVTGFTSGQEEAKFFIQDSILYIKGTQAHVDKGYITQSDLNEANNGWVEAWAYSDEYRISADDKYQVYYWFVIEDGYAFDKSNADKVKVSPSTVKLERIETGDTDYGAWVSYYADMYFTFGAAGNTPEDQPVEKPSHTHSYGSYKTTTKATFGKDGLQTAACNGCNSKKTKVIPAVKTPTLSTASYTFNNKVKTPSVTVKDSKGQKLTKVTSTSKNGYTVKYASGRKSVGKYAVTVTLTGANYSGKKTVYLTINPKGASVSKLSGAKKALTVKWNKPSSTYRKQMTGYQIRYSTSSKMKSAKTVTVKSTTATSKKISKLKAKKTYYVQLRTYKTVNGAKYYSGWSTAKKVKTK